MMKWTLLLVLAVGCADPDLATDQGRCTKLDKNLCEGDAACQQAFVDSGFQPQPTALRCLKLLDGAQTEGDCAMLDHDGCRARPDCSPMFWQRLGPTDSPEGAPEYQRCTWEMMVVF